MQAEATTSTPAESGADTVAVGLFEGERPDESVAGGALAALVESGEARARFRSLALARDEGRRWLVVGMGARADLDAERARVAAAVAHARAHELGTKTLCWVLPAEAGDDVAGGLVEGTLLAAYRFDRYRSRAEDEPAGIERLLVSDPRDRSDAVALAATLAGAQNAARDLQNMPANDLTPSRLAERAQELAGELDGLECDVEGREGIEHRGMGAFAGVARGSDQEPALITLRYEGPAAVGETLGLVGKAVTFDTGGISIKPASKMQEMKFDMSGGAAVIEALGAIARLRLPVRVVGVVGATENMPSGHAVKPGDIVRASDGTTIEVNNTDAEGRLVLADCMRHAVAQGAARLVDIATLTGAIVVTLGSTYAGLFGTDDGLCGTLEDAGRATGELLWRLPLHPEYAEMMKGRYADLINAGEVRKASSITAAEFLRRFAGDLPWAHIDIAGTAWDTDKPYAPKGGSGFGVRLLVELARRGGAAA
jgi:leucyl aminopeptidase